MKNKFSLFVLGLILAGTSYSQGNNGNTPADTNAQSNTRWKLDGNILSTDKFIGTLNQKDLIFKSNNVEGLRILPNKDFKIPGQIYIDLHRPLDLGKDRLLTVDSDGKVKSMEKSGLLGALYSSPCLDAGLNIHSPIWANIDGTVSPLTHGVLYTGTICPAWVGIGTDNPLAQLHVTTTGYFGNSINIGVNPSTLVARLNIEQPAPQRSGIVVNMTNSISSNLTGVGIKTIVNNPLRKAFTVVDGTTNQGVFVVKGNGSVGIGNNTPQTELDVTGSGFFKKGVSIGDFPSTRTKLYIYSSDQSQSIALHVDVPNAGDGSYVHMISIPNGKAKAIAILDKDTPGDSFNVLGNGTVHIRKQKAELKSLSVSNDGGENEDVFITYGNGATNIREQNGEAKSFYITSDKNEDVFRVMGNGNVWATKLNVALNNDFPDYVFADEYKLMSLKDLEDFISKEFHLPNMPTAEEVEKEGLDVGKINTLLVEKVEELTLYTIEQQKAIDALRKELELMKILINTKR